MASLETWVFMFEKYNLSVEAEDFSEACKAVEEFYYPGIFETERSFQVCKVTNFSRKVIEEDKEDRILKSWVDTINKRHFTEEYKGLPYFPDEEPVTIEEFLRALSWYYNEEVEEWGSPEEFFMGGSLFFSESREQKSFGGSLVPKLIPSIDDTITIASDIIMEYREWNSAELKEKKA